MRTASEQAIPMTSSGLEPRPVTPKRPGPPGEVCGKGAGRTSSCIWPPKRARGIRRHPVHRPPKTGVALSKPTADTCFTTSPAIPVPERDCGPGKCESGAGGLRCGACPRAEKDPRQAGRGSRPRGYRRPRGVSQGPGLTPGPTHGSTSVARGSLGDLIGDGARLSGSLSEVPQVLSADTPLSAQIRPPRGPRAVAPYARTRTRYRPFYYRWPSPQYPDLKGGSTDIGSE